LQTVRHLFNFKLCCHGALCRGD